MMAGGDSNLATLAEYDGPFRGLREGPRRERDGATWLTLSHPGEDWAIEIELSDRAPGLVEPIPPWRAWVIARSFDDPSTEIRELEASERRVTPPPPEFQAPASTLEQLRQRLATATTRSVLLATSSHDPVLGTMREVVRFSRDSRNWLRLVSPRGWIVDLELRDAPGGEVRPLPAELAERIVREPAPPPDL
jgi:hypothetical protein